MFYLGNDSSDEPVYELLKSKRVKNDYMHKECSKYICVLEKKPSEAEFYIEDLDSVRPLLEKLYMAAKKRKKIRSYADLTFQNRESGLKKGLENKKTASIANVSITPI